MNNIWRLILLQTFGYLFSHCSLHSLWIKKNGPNQIRVIALIIARSLDVDIFQILRIFLMVYDRDPSRTLGVTWQTLLEADNGSFLEENVEIITAILSEFRRTIRQKKLLGPWQYYTYALMRRTLETYFRNWEPYSFEVWKWKTLLLTLMQFYFFFNTLKILNTNFYFVKLSIWNSSAQIELKSLRNLQGRK